MNKPLRVSVRLRPGMLVTQRGGWIVPYNGTGRCLGAWSKGHQARFIGLDGRHVVVKIPSGIQTVGATHVRVAQGQP